MPNSVNIVLDDMNRVTEALAQIFQLRFYPGTAPNKAEEETIGMRF
jgi:hypothetical protein